jgi:hypothetical protein
VEPEKISGWLQVFQAHPVLIVLVFGLLAGTFVTQAIKYTYLKVYPKDVSDSRYSIGVWWLAILSTAASTQWFWLAVMPVDVKTHSLGHVTSVTAGFGSPCLYWLVKKLLAWWKPELAAKLGDGPADPEDK